jgi:hypothetical protein
VDERRHLATLPATVETIVPIYAIFPIQRAETTSERGQTEQNGDASELIFSQCAVAGQNQRAKDKANSAQNAAQQAGEQQSCAAPSAKAQSEQASESAVAKGKSLGNGSREGRKAIWTVTASPEKLSNLQSGGIWYIFRQPLYALRNVDTSPDVRVLGFTLMVALLTGVLFSLSPALQGSKPDLVATLKDNAPGLGRRSRLRNLLVSSQVALSLVLLVVAGVTVRRMQKIVNQDPGFATGNLMMMSISPSVQGYSEQQAQRFYEELLARVERIPGIQSASLAATVPPEDWSSRVSIFYEGQVPPLDYYRGHEFELGIRVDMNIVAPKYFRTMGIRIQQGRDFSESDGPGAPLVAIVSQRLAQRLWPDPSSGPPGRVRLGRPSRLSASPQTPSTARS